MSYQQRFYEYQTICRGVLEPDKLVSKFDGMALYYGSLVGKYLPKNPLISAIDLPCGYGNFLYFLTKRGYRNVKGYDSDPNQVALANSIQLPAFVMDAFEVLEDTAQYDLISSLDFLEHLTKDDALRFLDLCYASLKPGGTLILRTPCADGVFGAHDASNDITHQWNMSSNMMISILNMCGYQSVKVLEERPQPTNFLQLVRCVVYWPSRYLLNVMFIALGLCPPKVLSRSMVLIAHK